VLGDTDYHQLFAYTGKFCHFIHTETAVTLCPENMGYRGDQFALGLFFIFQGGLHLMLPNYYIVVVVKAFLR